LSGDRIWVFAGPSLPAAARPTSDVFLWRPPAIAGDALVAAEASPRAVVLIDGLFDHYPAIRHKELLALIDQGVPVVGAASMGALRAAELHVHGMIGVGDIFQAYASGRIVGDDEVAVLHGPAGMDWASLTLPLVNVRATLQRAARLRVISVATARTLRACAAGIFFQDRTWPVLMQAAAARDEAPSEELEGFTRWVATGYVELKRIDALRALAVAASLSGCSAARAPATAATLFADALARQVSAGLKPDPASS
jgi:hypothetical protein